MTLDARAVEACLPLWTALSELFLDTELNAADYRLVATAVLKSDFTATEVHHILWDEVFPALGDNLRVGTGEWAGFDDQWLRDRITNVLTGAERGLGSYGLIGKRDVRLIVEAAWRKVCRHLPPEYDTRRGTT